MAMSKSSSDALSLRAEYFPDEESVNQFAKRSNKNEKFNEGYASSKRNISIPLRFIAVDLWRGLSAEPTASHSEYCSGPRRLGRWFWLERSLRHSRQGRLQRQHRP